MLSQTPIRLFLLFCLSAPLAGQSVQSGQSAQSNQSDQSQKSPAQPPQQTPAAPAASTQLPPTAPSTVEPPSPPAPANHAKITYLDHQLTITADNSSLNQILHEVSQLTGIVITGGVAEERVFGTYGPARLSEVLGELLEGTATNVLFISSTADRPAQLILTPRGNGPTPPSPDSMRFNERAEADDPDVNPPEPSAESQSVAPPQPVAAAPAPAPATPSSGAPQNPASSSDPNAVKTPQQIYDQLMKLRQQQQSK